MTIENTAGPDLNDVVMSGRNLSDAAAQLDGEIASPPPAPLSVGIPCAGQKNARPSLDPNIQELVKLNAAEPPNDTGNGQRLLRLFGRDFMSVREVGWHVWQETHWTTAGAIEAVSQYAHRTAEYIAYEAEHIVATPMEARTIEMGDNAAASLAAIEAKEHKSADDVKDARRLKRLIAEADVADKAIVSRQTKRRFFAVNSGNSHKTIAAIKMAEPYCTIGPDQLDGDDDLFNVANGTLVFTRELDLECPDPDVKRYSSRVELRPHDRGDLITKIAAVEYDPTATCPRFMAFMDRFQPNMAVRDFLQTYHGYALTGRTGEQCLIYNYGLGANGKSTFTETISSLMGEYSMTLPFESIAGEGVRRGDQATPDIARLTAARFVRASEPDRNVAFKESLLKSLTGGEKMTARHLHKGFFEFDPKFKLSLSGNTKPEIGGVDHGIWRRMRLVPWTTTIPDNERRPIEEVLAEFEEERSGILNWLIEGALRYLAQGLDVPTEIKAATDEYREEMDPVGTFVRDCVQTVKDRTGSCRVTARSMYQAFVAWCHANSVRPWREKSFSGAMTAKGFARGRTSSMRFYENVLLQNVPTTSSDDFGPDMDDVVPA